jgi:chaperone modulatory protein CbpM
MSMTSARAQADRFDEGDRLRLSELADLADLTEAELVALVDCGALTAVEGPAGERVFGLRALTVARTARRLREDFELEPHGVALLLAFIDRIRVLEAQLRELQARIPR